MSRWTIERSGTGVERSGTGIEKSGTGIEKSGTGIEKSGTGIEKSGTGIQRCISLVPRAVFACVIALGTFASTVQASGNINPAGTLQLVANNGTMAVSWIFDGSVFAGVAPLTGSYANLTLTEVALSAPPMDVEVTGNGTGASLHVTGNGTGSSLEVTGNGTGSAVHVTGNGTGSAAHVTGNGTGFSVEVTGNGTGSSREVTGNGTGRSVLVTGNGTGSAVDVTGNGTGRSVQVTGNGTGRSVLVTGNGSGADAIRITLPEGTGMAMEVSLGCGKASVAVMGQSGAALATFNNVPVVGDTGLCSRGGFGGDFIRDPGRDFRSY
ncbi:hypothetical protein [Elongatibacter sediminis]|uniref:Auto-transporter adhesin head GIN domain-containing protein n=1 Tax=Elongatibacter sediminis TaxID=3119006 RepID=A0AAW9RCY7_9GAMM